MCMNYDCHKNNKNSPFFKEKWIESDKFVLTEISKKMKEKF